MWALGSSFDERDTMAAEKRTAMDKAGLSKLPDRLRYVGPYQEAQARLRGEPQPDWMTRCLNRAWIGRPQMDLRGKG